MYNNINAMAQHIHTQLNIIYSTCITLCISHTKKTKFQVCLIKFTDQN